MSLIGRTSIPSRRCPVGRGDGGAHPSCGHRVVPVADALRHSRDGAPGRAPRVVCEAAQGRRRGSAGSGYGPSASRAGSGPLRGSSGWAAGDVVRATPGHRGLSAPSARHVVRVQEPRPARSYPCSDRRTTANPRSLPLEPTRPRPHRSTCARKSGWAGGSVRVRAPPPGWAGVCGRAGGSGDRPPPSLYRPSISSLASTERLHPTLPRVTFHVDARAARVRVAQPV